MRKMATRSDARSFGQGEPIAKSDPAQKLDHRIADRFKVAEPVRQRFQIVHQMIENHHDNGKSSQKSSSQILFGAVFP